MHYNHTTGVSTPVYRPLQQLPCSCMLHLPPTSDLAGPSARRVMQGRVRQRTYVGRAVQHMWHATTHNCCAPEHCCRGCCSNACLYRRTLEMQAPTSVTPLQALPRPQTPQGPRQAPHGHMALDRAHAQPHRNPVSSTGSSPGSPVPDQPHGAHTC